MRISYRLRGVALVLLLIAAFGRVLHATSYRELGLGEIVQMSDLIVLVKLTPTGEKLDVTVEEVLKGTPPPDFAIQCISHTYKTEEGRERIYFSFGHDAAFGRDASEELDGLASSRRRLVFLRAEIDRELRPFHPDCMQLAAIKPRVLELLAMMRNPAPFVSSQKHQEDVDLIYLLGCLFYAVHVSAPGVPDLEAEFRPHHRICELVPWEHLRFTLKFTFVPTRRPMLEMEPLDAKGTLPDLIRWARDAGAFEAEANRRKDKLPAAFTVTVDTTRKTRVGDLSSEATAEFLRARLRSEKLEVVEAAFLALGKMLDRDAVPIAIDLLRQLHMDRQFRTVAARFLAWAKDSRSVEAICTTLDELPRCIFYAEPGYDEASCRLSSALAEAVANLNDVRTLPAVKRAVLKRHVGNGILRLWAGLAAKTLSRL